MKLYLILTALVLLTPGAMAKDFSGAFGREHLPQCGPATYNIENAAPDTCFMLGNGFGAPEARASTVPVPPPHECPPKGDYPA